MSSFLLLAAYAVAVGLSYAVYIIYHQFIYWKHRRMLHLNLVPLLGNNAPLFLRTKSFADHIENMYNKYPEALYYGFFDFKKPAIFIRSPDLVREICVKSFDSFVNHDNFVTEKMDPYVGRNLFSLEGQRWKEVRNTLTPSFTAARMKIIFELIAECSNDFVQYLLNHPEVAKDFEAKDAFTRYSNDVIGTSAFGVKVDSMKDPDNDFYRYIKAGLTFSPFGIVKLELLRIIPNFMRFLGTTFLPKSTDSFLKNLISETVKVRKEKGIIRQDMIHLLIQAMNKKDGPEVTIDDIVGQAFFFLLAGFDTSSSLMCFVCQELAANPDVQMKLHEEIDNQLEKDNGKINYDSLSQMKYLDMVVSETLRKYPTAPFTNRVCNEEIQLPSPMKGYPPYRIEKGTIIFLPIYGIHRDPEYFPEPNNFDPERFSEENKSSINPYAYYPFGVGPRQCIGNRFALMEVKVVIVNLLREFVIKFTEKSQHPVSYLKTTFTVTSNSGFWFELEPRKKSN